VTAKWSTWSWDAQHGLWMQVAEGTEAEMSDIVDRKRKAAARVLPSARFTMTPKSNPPMFAPDESAAAGQKAGPPGAGHIRWEPSTAFGGGDLGYVGTLTPWVFLIYYSDYKDWALMASTPGLGPGVHFHAADSEALKPEAEKWLREFVASLGATFREG
jgi:hypothetical protein